MEPERNEETNVNPEAFEDKHNRKTLAMTLSLTSLGFLVLEGLVCLFSQRTDPWHGYLWFAVTTLLCIAVLLLLSSCRHNGPTTLAAVLGALGAAGFVHAFMLLIYAETLLPATGLSELTLRVIPPLVIDLILAIRLFILDGESARMISKARDGTNPFLRKPSPEAWRSVAASVSFALLIVLSFVWSVSSSFRFYEEGQLATFDFSLLKPSPELLRSIRMQALLSCMHETIIRLFPLTIAHGSMLLASRIRVRCLRVVALASGFSLAAWGYVLVLMHTTARNSGWIAAYATWFIPLVIPFAFALLLSYRVRTRLSD